VQGGIYMGRARQPHSRPNHEMTRISSKGSSNRGLLEDASTIFFLGFYLIRNIDIEATVFAARHLGRSAMRRSRLFGVASSESLVIRLHCGESLGCLAHLAGRHRHQPKREAECPTGRSPTELPLFASMVFLTMAIVKK
jgi:hypothetical protein